MFNFLLQGTFQLLEGRVVVRQCSRELRACRAAKPGFFVVLLPKPVSILWIYVWSLEKKRVDVFVPVSRFIRIHEEGDESVSPICEPH